MKVIFMGTPDFAVASLDHIVKDGFDVVAVITAVDKPAGRGRKLNESAVKVYAKGNDIPVLQPKNLKAPEFIDELKSFEADLFVVVAFRMLPEVVWTMPSKGTINLHGSLLPNYRGAAPINWAVMNGETETGVTTFFIKHEIDTGSIIERRSIEITPVDTAGTLHDKMMIIGAELLVETLHKIENGEAKAIDQEEYITDKDGLKHAPKIFKEDCEINWDRSSHDIHNFVRGLNPFPIAWANYNDEKWRIFIGCPEIDEHSNLPGTMVTDQKKFLKFATRDGWYHIGTLQTPGKKRLNIEDFLRGYRFD